MTVNFRTTLSDWPPEGVIFPVGGADLRVLPGDHPFHARERRAAERNWQNEVAANPAFFDGRMVFFDRLALEDGLIRGEGHLMPFSTYLWWRRQPTPAGGLHLFAWAVPLSSDGALIAIRMAGHTANPGQVYCAAGSLDADDIVDGRCDLQGNMVREVREETGLDLDAAVAEPAFYAMHNRHRITVFRFFRFALTADEMLARIAAHMLVDTEQEIDAAVAIRSADHAAHPYGPPMLPLLDFHFGRAEAG